jgi:hypothetical protein
MFISCAASDANGFNKWSAAHPAAKYARQSDKATGIAPAVFDAGAPRADIAKSIRSIADFKHPTTHTGRAMRLRETAEAALVDGPPS